VVTATISVALCAFNGARFVSEQLESIAAQSRPAREIIVSDDGSTDETPALVDRFRGRSMIPVTILAGPRRGVTANFANAISAARGDYVALSDQDDVWHPDHLARLAASLDADPRVLLVHSDARLVAEDGLPLGPGLVEALRWRPDELRAATSGDSFAALIRRNLVTGATAMFRRELAAPALPIPPEWLHDEWLAIVAAAVGRTAFVPEQLLDYRQHGANQVGARKRGVAERAARIAEPRAHRLRLLADRSAALRERLTELEVAESVTRLVAAKLEFERNRAQYPDSRLRRIAPVLRQWRSGDYARLSSQGSLDVLRDLLQPA
jgi:glycosyltransferase involved in cell wall biosynthesis